jgi:probable HAF family extracellular repeat protein
MRLAKLFLTRSCVMLMMAGTIAPYASGQNYTVTDLGSLDAAGALNVSYAGGVNSLGDVVGSSYMGMSLHAYSWTKTEGMKDLGTLGGSNSIAYAINNSGTVVGQTDLANRDKHAFFWTTPRGMQDLGTLGGGRERGFWNQ